MNSASAVVASGRYTAARWQFWNASRTAVAPLDRRPHRVAGHHPPGPQQRVTAACAASNEPRAASSAASRAMAWDGRQAGSDKAASAGGG